MGDNCNPENCIRCDKYNAMEEDFKTSISTSPHIPAAAKEHMLAKLVLMGSKQKRAILRGFKLFNTLKKPDTPKSVRQQLRAHADYEAFLTFYTEAIKTK